MSDFFFKDTATTEIYTYCHTLSLHDALPICWTRADIERWSDLFARYFYAQGLRPGDVYQIMVGYAWFVGGMGITQGVHRLGATGIPAGNQDSRRPIETMFQYGTTAVFVTPSFAAPLEIGRASCRERVGRYVW